MATTNDRVIEEALSLPADARLNLIEKLLMSLNLPIDDELDRLWTEEAERRVSQIEEGTVQLVPGEEVEEIGSAHHRESKRIIGGME
jgi:putative addiction module component (TIGR02574 family)